MYRRSFLKGIIGSVTAMFTLKAERPECPEFSANWSEQDEIAYKFLKQVSDGHDEVIKQKRNKDNYIFVVSIVTNQEGYELFKYAHFRAYEHKPKIITEEILEKMSHRFTSVLHYANETDEHMEFQFKPIRLSNNFNTHKPCVRFLLSEWGTV